MTRTHLMALLAAAALALPAPGVSAQTINEVYTGTPDWVEIVNFGASTVDLSAYLLVITYSTSTTNTFVFPGAPGSGTAVLAPGAICVVSDSTSAPTVPAGVTRYTTAFNIPWVAGTAGAVCLATPAGAGVDLVAFSNATFIPSCPGTTFTGSVPGTLDLKERISLLDTNVAADWANSNGAGTPGVLNPAETLPFIGMNITTAGGGSVTVTVTTLNPAVPGGEVYCLYSLTGTGPLLGLSLDALPFLTVPFGTPFVHYPLGPAGTRSDSSGPGSIPPGITIYGVAALLQFPGGFTRISTVRTLAF